MPYGTLPSSASQDVERFELHVEEQKLHNLKQLLRLSPVVKEAYENAEDRGLGVTREWVLNAKADWEGTFNWREHEQHINSFPNFKAQVLDDGGHAFSIHFAALVSKRPDAIPILFLHGWPGSFQEFLPLMDLLRRKYTPETLPYHIIAASLPGYTLSSPPPLTRNWKIADTARIMHKLMLTLGFSSYISQGGDIGAAIARVIAANYTECKAVHLNFCFMLEPPSPVPDSAISPKEQKGLQRWRDFCATGTAYGLAHGTRSSTIGIVLSSSPVALLAWIGEKFLEWSDQTPDLPTILAHVSLYWLTGCFPTGLYPYREDFQIPQATAYFHGQEGLYIDKPLGYSGFAFEIGPMPRAWIEQTGRLVWFKTHDKGGHFAALERPDALLEDVESFLEAMKKG